MLRRIKVLALAAVWAACACGATAPNVLAQAQAKEEKAGDKKKDAAAGLTADSIAETVIYVHGSRPVLEQVRRTGVERGRVSRSNGDGTNVEIAYERFFKRGETSDKDKIRIDQKRADLEYSLIYNDGRVWGVIKGTSFTPRQEELSDFDASRQHGLENLLRYKEDGMTLAFVGKDKQKNIDMWVIDVTDKQNRRTRFYISAQSARVLWLEYEEAPQGGGAPVKYRKTLHDYRIVQGTRVPYRTILYANEKRVEELQIMTVTYGVKMEDSMFKNQEAAAN